MKFHFPDAPCMASSVWHIYLHRGGLKDPCIGLYRYIIGVGYIHGVFGLGWSSFNLGDKRGRPTIGVQFQRGRGGPQTDHRQESQTFGRDQPPLDQSRRGVHGNLKVQCT